MNDILQNILTVASTITPASAWGEVPPVDSHGLFDVAGTLLPQPAIFWAEKTMPQRALFGHEHGVYSFPTVEGVEFIRQAIAGRELQTIEVGAGNGGWCKALGIRGTDSYLQRRKDIAARYASMRQPPASYGAHVEKLEAIKAVRKYRPTIVIASWVTQKFRADRFSMRGNVDGVDELRLLELVDEYILIGNTNSHGDKIILEDLHAGASTHEVAGLITEDVYSRAQAGEDFIIHLRRRAGINVGAMKIA